MSFRFRKSPRIDEAYSRGCALGESADQEISMQKNWILRNSFTFVCFVVPIALIFSAFLKFLPTEVLRTKPKLFDAVLALGGAVLAFVILVPIFAVVWVALMRMIFGKRSVSSFLETTTLDRSAGASGIDRTIVSLCRRLL